jgi:hypothetical protein
VWDKALTLLAESQLANGESGKFDILLMKKKKKKKKKKTYVEGAVLVARHGWETRSRLHTRGGATR